MWDGVEALEQKDGQALVTALVLPNRHILGPFDCLRSLTALVALILPDNQLTGSVTCLSDCRSLEVLNLARNALTGGLEGKGQGSIYRSADGQYYQVRSEAKPRHPGIISHISTARNL